MRAWASSVRLAEAVSTWRVPAAVCWLACRMFWSAWALRKFPVSFFLFVFFGLAGLVLWLSLSHVKSNMKHRNVPKNVPKMALFPG